MNRREFNLMMLASGAMSTAGMMFPTTVIGKTASGGLAAIIQPEPPVLNLALN